ncbi:MAG: hypothetical protein HYV02_07285 [Deltaproteobacteria bacterium]|nr:hypothetical protein [Deltaproteobacteria bacterium]
MTNLNIRGIPDDLYALLKFQAKQEARSLNQEVLWLLRKSLAEMPVDPHLWGRIDNRRHKSSRQKRHSNSVSLLRKDRGRLS